MHSWLCVSWPATTLFLTSAFESKNSCTTRTYFMTTTVLESCGKQLFVSPDGCTVLWVIKHMLIIFLYSPIYMGFTAHIYVNSFILYFNSHFPRVVCVFCFIIHILFRFLIVLGFYFKEKSLWFTIQLQIQMHKYIHIIFNFAFTFYIYIYVYNIYLNSYYKLDY